MRIDLIREVIEAGLDDGLIEEFIIQILARDENLIPTLMRILDAERKTKSKLITEMNFQLSRADIGLDDPKVINEDDFIQKEIKEFYAKFKDSVGHCFKDYGKNEPKEDEGLV